MISEASRATAKLLTGDKSEYAIDGSVAINEDDDLALLQIGAGIEPADDPYLAVLVPRGRPLSVAGGEIRNEIGDTVYVAGNPEGLEGTFSQGIISAFRGTDYIQITAPISPGSSGGPVMNQRGDVIGVATLFSKEGQNLNFAVPVSRLVSLLGRVTNVRPLAPRTNNELRSLTPTSSPQPQPRTESLVSASDTLFVEATSRRTEGFHKEDSRSYRFYLNENARVKGVFSANGGRVYVQIVSAKGIYYSSGEISSDSFEKTLPAGTYTMEVALISPGAVGFSVQLTAIYDH